MKKIAKKVCVLLLVSLLGSLLLTGCGNGIKDETKKAITDKTNQALELYSDIEKTVSEHALTAEKEFTDMKKKLTDMSVKVKAGIEDTTEDDGQQTTKELDKIINNLQTIKDKLEKTIAAVTE